MNRKIIRVTPDQLGYKDRGKMKWMGLMLSDHTDALREIEKERTAPKPKAKRLMDEVEISSLLLRAYTSKQPILLQANTVKNGLYYPDLECLVLGFNESTIYFEMKDKRTFTCELNQIRNIDFMDPLEWHEKRLDDK